MELERCLIQFVVLVNPSVEARPSILATTLIVELWEISMFVYFLRAGNHGAIKIGIAEDMDHRVATLQTGNAFKLHVIALIPCDCREQAAHLEKSIHKFYARQRIRGEWFQGNIDFRKMSKIVDVDQTCSSLNKPKSDYKPVRNAKKKRRAKRLKLQTLQQ